MYFCYRCEIMLIMCQHLKSGFKSAPQCVCSFETMLYLQAPYHSLNIKYQLRALRHMASLTLLDQSTQTSLSTIISPQPTPTSSPTSASPLLITPNDLSAPATIQTVTFGVLSILLAIAAIILAYLQLRHQYRTHSRHIAATDPETPSHRTSLLRAILHHAMLTDN